LGLDPARLALDEDGYQVSLTRKPNDSAALMLPGAFQGLAYGGGDGA
jgi:hypothetical protein